MWWHKKEEVIAQSPARRKPMMLRIVVGPDSSCVRVLGTDLSWYEGILKITNNDEAVASFKQWLYVVTESMEDKNNAAT